VSVLRLAGVALAGVLLLAVLGACAGRTQRFEYARVSMGVPVRVVLYARDEAAGEAAARAAFDEIARLDAMLSDYRRDSVVTRLGERAGVEAVEAPCDLVHLLRVAAAVSEASDGAFDVTMGPSVRLWREARRTGRLPARSEIDAAGALVDWRAVTLPVGESGPVRLERTGMALDLGGIAKGYAASRAVEVLRARGVRSSLVSLAGDVAAGDAPPGRDGWRVAIRGERSGEAEPALGTLRLRNAAVSTSGDAAQFVEIEGVRYAHIVDPRTGLGSTRRVQATVVARRGEWADALATALCVAPSERAERLRALAGDAACVIVEGGSVRLIDPAGRLRWEGDQPPAGIVVGDFAGGSGLAGSSGGSGGGGMRR
jgi:thiamine biosynthesis lipoprotein